MTNLHLIMPMGGKGQRFFDNGFVMPKPLITIHNKPFFYWAVMSVKKFIPDCEVSFVVLQEHVEKFNIVYEIEKYFPESRIITIPEVLDGAVLTCLEGIRAIHDDLPIVFNDCDHMFQCSSLRKMLEMGDNRIDGALITFESTQPQFSYVECDKRGIVLRTAEKQVISSQAICGAYYFRNKHVFIDNAKKYLEECRYSEYFMSGIYDCMAKSGLYSIVLETDFHISFGTPAEYYAAESKEEFEVFL